MHVITLFFYIILFFYAGKTENLGALFDDIIKQKKILSSC